MSSNLPLKIKVIIGSTRQNRFSDKPAYWIFDELGRRDDVEAEILDLRDYPMPFFDDATAPIMLKGNYSNEVVKNWAEKIKDGDAFIIVVPEYNHGYPAVLKNALDHLFSEWNNKPVGFISFGGVGGARCIEQLRQVAIGFKMVPIRDAIHIPMHMYLSIVNKQVPVDPEAFEPLRHGIFGDSIEAFLNELTSTTSALKSGREQFVVQPT